MMCIPCQEAGKSITRAKQEGRAIVPAAFLPAFHDQCEWPNTCTCQHVVSFSAINRGQPT